MIKIRLRRVGKKKHPHYRVVVARNEAKRDGAFIENLGWYDPHQTPPRAELNAERAKEWLGKGAQPSEAAEKILRRAGIITTPAPERKRPATQEPAKAAATAAPAQAEAPTEAPAAEAEPVATDAAGATPPAAADEAEPSADTE